MDPDPAFFIIDLQDANKKQFFVQFLHDDRRLRIRIHTSD
jgi:hypothetical protein